MYIRVIDDIFEISHRIKDIDDGYFVLYNTVAKIFEIHNYKQRDTFCVSSEHLNAAVLNKLHKTKTVYLKKILSEIEEKNEKIAEKSYLDSISEAKEKFDDIMQYLDCGKNYDPKYT